MNYIALTIGPIYETILNAKKVRDLFGGSYFFSLFMRRLLKELSSHKIHIVVPYIDEEKKVLEDGSLIGLFHDRFIGYSELESKELSDILERSIDKVLDDLSEIISTPKCKAELQEALDYHTLIAKDSELANINSNVVFAINAILDAKELERNFSINISFSQQYTIQRDDEIKGKKAGEALENLNPIRLFGLNIHRIKKSLKMESLYSFKSTGDIASKDKYYVVVTADGDKMGNTISDLMQDGDIEKIKPLSKKLYRFFTDSEDGKKNIRQITNDKFGGELIFAGGDDILALIPTQHDDVTFLDYIDELDKRFKEYIGNGVSLSFGVNIVYYKYPMKRAISDAFELLHNAKIDKTIEQNALKMRTTKHSGQYFESTFSLSDDSYTSHYKPLVKAILQSKASLNSGKELDAETKESLVALPHSLQHSLKLYESAIVAVRKNNSSLEPMFKNLFDDMRSASEERGLDMVREYIDSIPQGQFDFDKLFSELSLIKFLRGDRL